MPNIEGDNGCYVKSHGCPELESLTLYDWGTCGNELKMKIPGHFNQLKAYSFEIDTIYKNGQGICKEDTKFEFV